MALPQQFLDELRARLTLSTIISRRTRLTRRGREHVGLCPFHKEKTPSFTVNDEKGFYHCLAAETGVVVRDGIRPIADLAGTSTEVLSRGGRWIPATFKSYGVQKLLRLELTRNGQSKTLHATSGHRWFVRGVKGAVVTTDLRPGHRLEAVVQEPRSDWPLDPAGVRHGIVFGDGSLGKGVYGHVHLHGDKDAVLREWFPDQQAVERLTETGKPFLRVYGGRAFEHMKALPSAGASDAYLLGFLAGHLAADGHVAKDGTVMLHSADRSILEWLRATCRRLGITTYGVTTARRRGLGTEDSDIHRLHFVPASLDPSLFLLPLARARFSDSKKRFARLRWTVRSVTETDREEEVYCAEVPEEHAFALEDDILTGNCFGCGAHGDVISFEMEQGNLSFMEAVEKLAGEAGLEVPQATPREAAEAKRRATVLEVIEAACAFFEQQLRMPAGAEGLAYLRRRDLDDATIRRFRLGYAPGAGVLKGALARQGIDEERLVEAGLLKRRDDGSVGEYFRDRVMFPITDRRGRVIAFGGRTLGDGQPKYLNSPDTPVFHKGQVLYNLAGAREPAAKAREVVVAEGYMDVIAFTRAGIPQAVAPLGTALTETQITELWKLADEPILCFDADSAGQRAAAKAAERALPILEPGKSLRFALLAGGKDPDDILRDKGPAALRDGLDSAIPLLEALWRQVAGGHDVSTPERRAALEAALEERVRAIADRSIQQHYRQAFRDRCWQLFRPQRPQRPQGGTPTFSGARSGKGGKGKWQAAAPRWSAPLPPSPTPGGPPIDPGAADALRRRILVATLIMHPELFDTVGERLGLLDIPEPSLDSLRGAVLTLLGREPSLDSEGIRDHLRADGLGHELDSLLTSNVFIHAAFSRPGSESQSARRGWEHTFDLMIRRTELKADIDRVVARLGDDPTEATYETFVALKNQDRMADGDD